MREVSVHAGVPLRGVFPIPVAGLGAASVSAPLTAGAGATLPLLCA